MKTKKIRIVLFDDNLFFRQFINIMMDGRKDIDLAGVFENANNLVRDIEATMPDMVLMDLDMPGTNGIAAVKILRKKFPELPVMILTDYDKEEMIVDAISAGANGYILKVSSEQKIIDAIFDVHRGEGSLSPAVTRKLLYLLSGKSRGSGMQDMESLSPREREVLGHLVRGKSYKIIASEMGIGYDTVRAHIKAIYRKLKVGSVSGAVAKAMKSDMFLRMRS